MGTQLNIAIARKLVAAVSDRRDAAVFRSKCLALLAQGARLCVLKPEYTVGSRPIKAVVWIALLLVCCAPAFALDPSLDVSQYAHTPWKIRDGFTRGTINSMAQTADGYLWLGTEFGLIRFDGARAVQWQPPAGEPLPDDLIQGLLAGRDGTLWIASRKGIASWKDGKLTKYPEVAGQMIQTLAQDGQGTVWVGLNDPGRLCAIQDRKVNCGGAGAFGDSVIALYVDRQATLWVSAGTGLWRWAPGPREHYTFADARVEARALSESDSGALLMATAVLGGSPNAGSIEGLKQLAGGKIESYAPVGLAGQLRPTCLFRSRDGSLWVGTVQGLVHFHEGRIDRFAARDGLSGDVVKSIFEDREGDVWVSTQDGLDRFREFAVSTISLNQGLSNSAVYLVEATPDQSIWIGTADGLDRWQNGHVTNYGRQKAADPSSRPVKLEIAIGAAVTKIADSGLQGTPQSLGHDERGRLWAATREGVFYLDGGRFARVPGVPGGNIFSMTGDGQGRVWISNNDEGLFCWTPDGGVQHIPWARFGQKRGATALVADPIHGALWLGFSDGGIASWKDGEVRASYSAADGLGNGRVSDFQLSSDGAVWAATEGGLSRVKDGRVATLSSKNHLPCDAVQWVMEDNDQAFWLYMPCGLVRLARSELEAWAKDSNRALETTVFDSFEGVRSRATAGRYGPKVVKSMDGKLWFVALDGVSIIDPRHLQSNPLPPAVHIEQVTADSKKYDAGSGLRLPPHIRDLVIDYTALSLAAPEKVHFRFKLEGQDQDWREVVNVRKVEYSNLPPRKYRFRVIASNNSGVWNETGDKLEFSIAPAYYQTNLFRLACLGAFFMVFWGLYRYRLHQVAWQFNVQLEARVEERTRIARELHDTLLQTFQAALFEFQAARNLFSKGRQEAIQTLDSAIRAAQGAIVEGRDAIHDLRHTAGPQAHLENLFKTAGEELASSEVSNGSRPAFRVTVEGTAQTLPPLLQDEIFQIGHEVLRNAFRHANARRIEAEIRYDDRMFRLRIRDNGKGIDRKIMEEGIRPGHWGLPGVRERAKRIGARLVFWSEAGAGTEVELEIPARLAYSNSHARRRFGLFRKNGEAS